MLTPQKPSTPFDLVSSNDEPPPRIDATANIDATAKVGSGSVISHLAQVREFAHLGSDCYLGRGAYIGPGVIVGKNCTIENYALVYEPALLEDGVFVGAGVVFTNHLHPRAVSPDGTRKLEDDRRPVGVTVRSGASIGARALCVAPITIGRWAMVAAGATVVTDVPNHAMVSGVPARRTGWVGRAGVPLEALGDGIFGCPASGERYRMSAGTLSHIVEEK